MNFLFFLVGKIIKPVNNFVKDLYIKMWEDMRF